MTRSRWTAIRAKVTFVDGIRFPSKQEATRYSELKLLEKAGEITDLELQPRFPLGTDDAPILIKSEGYPNGRRATAVMDFRYYDTRAGWTIVEDVKGKDNPYSRLKRAIVEAQYKIEVRLIKGT